MPEQEASGNRMYRRGEARWRGTRRSNPEGARTGKEREYEEHGTWHLRPGTHGRQHGDTLARGGHRVVAPIAARGPSRKRRPTARFRPTPSRRWCRSCKDSPRIVWLMVPSGQVTDDTLRHIMSAAQAGDIIIDGGNSNYRTRFAARRRSGQGHALHGLRHERRHLGAEGRLQSDDRRRGRPSSTASRSSRRWRRANGYGYMGPNGAGHFVKMVHNGVEYGMLQAYGEGFEILEKSQFNLDLCEVTRVWQHGSVVRSWLLDLAGGWRSRTTPTLARYQVATSRIPARAAGRCRRRSTRTCPRRSSRSRCCSASSRASRNPSPRR